ncbi:glycosyltransferase [Leucobacter denitrificans]|uniref:Glycosyltransferase n=1 Tax=Leucobacter denitrificans TaxID=683042 RepID=A0A7G9S3K4_9MICO|nr:glycosyltransferase [Leucobacter denitrificans]
MANSFSESGHTVNVLTVKPARGARTNDADRTYKVRRFPVLRDSSGYVRGYLQYLSFDIPIFFRILFGARRDIFVVEPPPTTGLFVRIASGLRRIPYIYYAADIWSDAAAQTGAPKWILRLVRAVELLAMRGASKIVSVSVDLTERLHEFGVQPPIVTVGNGVDTDRLSKSLQATVTSGETRRESRVFVYAGTASEVHGAEIFVEAMPMVLKTYPDVRLRFIGGGSERDSLIRRVNQLGISHAVTFESTKQIEELAPILRQATVAIASVRPNSGYDFAFPTKLYAAAVCGAKLLYTGNGPARDFVNVELSGEPLGTAVDFDPLSVASAMVELIREEQSIERRIAVSTWAKEALSLKKVSERIVEVASQVVDKEGPKA